MFTFLVKLITLLEFQVKIKRLVRKLSMIFIVKKKKNLKT